MGAAKAEIPWEALALRNENDENLEPKKKTGNVMPGERVRQKNDPKGGLLREVLREGSRHWIGSRWSLTRNTGWWNSLQASKWEKRGAQKKGVLTTRCKGTPGGVGTNSDN